MASGLQKVVSPHSAHTEEQYMMQHGGRVRTGTFTVNNLPPGADRIVAAVRDLFRARTMQDYCETLPAFARDVVWDAPPIMTSRKGHLRVASYLAKFAANLDLEPGLVTIKHLSGDRHLVDITGTVRVMPKGRTWLLPPTMLLPESIPIRTTIRVGVNGTLADGQIEMIYGQWHNLPSLPSPLRNLNGLLLGGLPHMLEPLWSRAMEYLGDDFYKRKRERHIADGTAGAVDTAIDLGSNAVHSLGDAVSNFIDMGRHYADTTLQTAREGARSAADTASGVARSAADTASGVARSAADTASGVARSAYETVMPSDMPPAREVPSKAGEALSKAAERAKESARSAGVALDPSGAQTQAVR
ncbi:hypothetical protein Rsub_03946 [Raphidocelis subcapitata]|uniref:Uncharacterized protein n=1 Tax=Raphidocelis subcapitata TaxID=307507 RepID=A0A2V0NY84_9CHLO|nr:hypothetical protein Rsub_03946 [Raphidocelis subcapitata]|eukprot:GBF91642.1 hypothetical protein Rsub_03946 [Raphidocelis subcapitata]